jgi:hypothetical protein
MRLAGHHMGLYVSSTEVVGAMINQHSVSSEGIHLDIDHFGLAITDSTQLLDRGN